MNDEDLFSEEKPKETKEESLSKDTFRRVVNIIQDFQQQIHIWHVNSKGRFHMATEQAYEDLQEPLDGLLEAYQFENGDYAKEDYPKLESTFSAESATAKGKKFILMMNKIAKDIDDEGIKSYIGDVINAVRSMCFKF